MAQLANKTLDVMDVILVLNSGSTSVKFAVYPMALAVPATPVCHGAISDMQGAPTFSVKDADGVNSGTHNCGDGHPVDHTAAVSFILAWIAANHKNTIVRGAGHRVVLGGDRYQEPVLITHEVLTHLDALTTMEPSHQAYNIAGVRAVAKAHPGLTQVACFDSAFHRTMPKIAQTYALPKSVRDAGVRHWGYHGISYDYISRQILSVAPQARRVIVAHLGGGASMCAMLDGQSIDTTMGFAAASGLPMATRVGDLPVGALFYLLREGMYDVASLEAMLYEQSGMLGLSGISGDMRVLQDSPDPHATDAIAQFCYAIARYTGAYTVALEGLDALVFTGGIGENSAPVRAAVCARLGALGVQLDEVANTQGELCISTVDSKVSVWVIPTNEEGMIAQHTLSLIQT